MLCTVRKWSTLMALGWARSSCRHECEARQREVRRHDVTRHVTRYGRPDTSTAAGIRQYNLVVDEDLGRRRARAAALLTMALPGAVCIYQGEELGLPEGEDIPAHRRDDPIRHRTNGEDPGRDGCRVPLPWNGTTEPYGFSPGSALHLPGSRSPQPGRG